MCDMASFILTQNRVLWHPKSDSHSDILEKYEITDDSYKPNFVKVEIVPIDEDYRQPIEKWVYSVDQDYFPEWYNSVEAEKACREELKNWYAEKVITKGKHTFSGLVYKIILGGNVTINDLKEGSEVWVYGKSKVEVNNMKGGNIWFYVKSVGKLNNQTGGDVVFYDISVGTINKQHGGIIYFNEYSTGTLNDQSGGYIYFKDESIGNINNHSKGEVIFCDDSNGTINSQSGGDISFHSSSHGVLNEQSGGTCSFNGESTGKINIENKDRVFIGKHAKIV